ncbi:mono/diheme cytochrome c family protein [Paraburkholderia eburnea]|uniref:Mono/diheme cytochrome c family protein n=1 Tax=Paraburkholderia eburnea TaxID=1189126 RepID=A0A2S4LTN2_9BURK|nr:cytochrome c [Paraburkholderia eburnea]POR45817.1 mono/diheme cytochrome c family protein [Paraburkholderia eburnea]PRZ14674.1 mono/diheme cytochrome c family protein [Paraburkholderia eburnea]
MSRPRANWLVAVAVIAITGTCLVVLPGACDKRDDASAATALKPPPDATLIALGEQLAKAGDCASCHDSARREPFAGGQPVNSPFGPIYASNITPDPLHGIGRYSPEQFAAALQDGVAPGGKRLYPAMPYPSFAALDRHDIDALYQYFMYGVTPVANATPSTRLPFPFNQRWVLLFWRLLFAQHGRFEPDPAHDAQWNRGAWLVQGLGHCGACHTPRGPAYNEMGYTEHSPLYLTGGLADHWSAPNLTGDTGSGLGRWSTEDIVAFLRDGHNARAYAFGAMAPVVGASTQYLDGDDLRAIAAYLKSLPVRAASGAYTDSAAARAATQATLYNGVPELPGAGVYLAFCAKCHGADGRGTPDKAPPLAGSALALSADATSALRIIIEGSESPQTPNGGEPRRMPAFRAQFTDSEIAQVTSFVRNAWGNRAAAVAPAEVTRLRAAIHR